LNTFSRRYAPSWLALAVAVATTTAAGTARAADGGNPCGLFDFSQGLDCKIEVSASCSAECTPLQFEVACTGGCTAQMPPDPMCTTYCDSSCSTTCDPNAIDCMAGCHGECDQSMTGICQQQTPTADCVAQARAQCDMHCKQSCSGAATSCPGQCHACCIGSCTGQINYQCDYNCYADLQGSCSVQCMQPAGAIFCGGQYVHASDVEACIAYLATQGVSVDLSARASVQCGPGGCTSSTSGSAATACAVSAVGSGDPAPLGVSLGAAAFALAAAWLGRRRRTRLSPAR
jgi:MYXO-CTERM domain-containing protein